MARVLKCPSCGAPLSREGAANLIAECAYCHHPIELPGHRDARPSPQREAPARPPGTSEPIERRLERAKRNDGLAALFVGLLIVAGAIVAVVMYVVLGKPDPQTELDGDQALLGLDFTSSHDDVKARFGSTVSPSSTPWQVTLTFPGTKGAVWSATIHGEPISQISLKVRAGFDFDHAISRLRTLVPHRVEQRGIDVRVAQGDAVLDFAAYAVTVSHRLSLQPRDVEHANTTERLDALWAIARAVVLDGPAPTPAQLKLANGPTLVEAAELDHSIAVEGAADAFRAAFPSGWCRVEGGLMCVLDVDHAFVNDARWLWPNALRARPQALRLNLRQRPDGDKVTRALASCMEQVLGTAQENVVDYTSGIRTFSWKLGDTHETVELGQGYLVLRGAESASVEKVPSWTSSLPALMAAIHGCTP